MSIGCPTLAQPDSHFLAEDYAPLPRRQEVLACHECGAKLDPYNVEPEENEQGYALCRAHAARERELRDERMIRYRMMVSRLETQELQMVRVMRLIGETDYQNLAEYMGESAVLTINRLNRCFKKGWVGNRVMLPEPNRFTKHPHGKIVWFEADPMQPQQMKSAAIDLQAISLSILSQHTEMTTIQFTVEMEHENTYKNRQRSIGRLRRMEKLGLVNCRVVLSPPGQGMRYKTLFWSLV